MTPEPELLEVTEIFHSIQGESSHAGRPCVFVRLTGCSLRCGYCDTTYSYTGGTHLPVDEIVAQVLAFGTRLVEITGGEPLEQPGAVRLMRALIGKGCTVMLETGGHVSVDHVPREVIKIIDVKCPDSGEPDTFLMSNIGLAAPQDEFKFVISTQRDYAWSRDFFRNHLASLPNTTLFAPVHGDVEPSDLAGWILEDALPVRLQLQLHKYVWDPDQRGI
jgi:7-carboxy-7-deazaguanine synthase